MRDIIALRLRELRWTVARAVGLGPDDPPDNTAHRIVGGLLTALYWLPAAFIRRTNIRFIDPHPWIIEAVGHLATDFDSYLKDRILAECDVKPVVLCASYVPANEALLSHWSKHFIIVRNAFLAAVFRPFMRFPDLAESLEVYCSVMRGPSRTFDVQRRWGAREPLLQLNEAETAKGEEALRRMGIPEGAWFVCVHAREGGYDAGHEWVHSYRNANIAAYTDAMEAIVARGGWCIRMGDKSMRPLPAMSNVIDYAVSLFKSAEMDLFLCARCRFFLGNSSGLFNVAGVFGRPSALANLAPLGCVYSFFPADISIPKRLADANGDITPFVTAFADPASEYRLASEFDARGLTQIDNTPDEIRALAIEMLDRPDERFVSTADDEDLQDRFRAFVTPHHYSSGAASRIGTEFLRQHRDALAAPVPQAERRSA